jgi:hypothetical protein
LGTIPQWRPVSISVEKAKPIQWGRIRAAYHEEQKRREESFDPRPELRVDWGVIRTSIKRAGDTDELRRIWPRGMDERRY